MEDINTIEEYIDFLFNLRKEDPNNIQAFVDNIKEKFDKNSQDYKLYIEYGLVAYASGRVLYNQGFMFYGAFIAHQTLELYLKAYLLFKETIPATTHDLVKLLDKAKLLTTEYESFIHSYRMKLIVLKFNPFYEFPRYPYYFNGPRTNIMLSTRDFYLVDYFIYKMNQIFEIDESDKVFGQMKLHLSNYKNKGVDRFSINNLNKINY